MSEKKELDILVGKNLAAARESKGVTQVVLAEKIGVTNQFISDLERGITGVSLLNLKKICLALDISADTLIFGSSDNPYTAAAMEKMSGLGVKEYDAVMQVTDLLLAGNKGKGKKAR